MPTPTIRPSDAGLLPASTVRTEVFAREGSAETQSACRVALRILFRAGIVGGLVVVFSSASVLYVPGHLVFGYILTPKLLAGVIFSASMIAGFVLTVKAVCCQRKLQPSSNNSTELAVSSTPEGKQQEKSFATEKDPLNSPFFNPQPPEVPSSETTPSKYLGGAFDAAAAASPSPTKVTPFQREETTRMLLPQQEFGLLIENIQDNSDIKQQAAAPNLIKFVLQQLSNVPKDLEVKVYKQIHYVLKEYLKRNPQDQKKCKLAMQKLGLLCYQKGIDRPKAKDTYSLDALSEIATAGRFLTLGLVGVSAPRETVIIYYTIICAGLVTLKAPTEPVNTIALDKIEKNKNGRFSTNSLRKLSANEIRKNGLTILKAMQQITPDDEAVNTALAIINSSQYRPQEQKEEKKGVSEQVTSS
ncbi:MAG: hypothetical protein H0X51_04730 [Parachlamydiaceae bacterium]|nr:hypothetical protein [Parachlamydiaceae bacterium]